MVETDLGEATIVYEDPDGDAAEMTVENEHLAYFQDHWIVKMEDREDHDVVKRIPAQRVYHVERSVEEFEREAGTVVDEFEREIESLRDAVRSVTGDLPKALFGGQKRHEPKEADVTRIDIGEGDGDAGTGGSVGVGTGDDEAGGDETGGRDGTEDGGAAGGGPSDT